VDREDEAVRVLAKMLAYLVVDDGSAAARVDAMLRGAEDADPELAACAAQLLARLSASDSSP
jgi:hypothetical protein